MKTMLKFTLVAALFAVVNTAFTAENLKVNITPLKDEKAVVAVSTLTNSSVNISVTDYNNGVVYYNETIHPGENYRKIFDFSEFDEGYYKLFVESNKLMTEQSFQILDDEIIPGKEKTTMEPYFGYKDGILRCTYLNFPKEKLKLAFYEKDQLIYKKEIGRVFNVVEGLNLSKLEKGNYKAVLFAGDREYIYRIDIQ